MNPNRKHPNSMLDDQLAQEAQKPCCDRCSFLRPPIKPKKARILDPQVTPNGGSPLSVGCNMVCRLHQPLHNEVLHSKWVGGFMNQESCDTPRCYLANDTRVLQGCPSPYERSVKPWLCSDTSAIQTSDVSRFTQCHRRASILPSDFYQRYRSC